VLLVVFRPPRLAVLGSDVSIACEQFFAYNKLNPPQASSTLSLAEVDGFLDELTTATKDGEQTDIWRRIVVRVGRKLCFSH
jgi:hypothetical protein